MTSEESAINDHRELIKGTDAASNAGNIDEVLLTLHPDVKWARAWEGDDATGHEEVRAYWEQDNN